MVFGSLWGIFIHFPSQDRGLCEFPAGLELTIQQGMILNFWTSFCLYFPSPRVRGTFTCLCSDRDWIQASSRHALCQLSCTSSCRCPTSYHCPSMAFICPVSQSCFLPPQQSGPKLCRKKLFHSQIPKKKKKGYFNSSFSQLPRRKYICTSWWSMGFISR